MKSVSEAMVTVGADGARPADRWRWEGYPRFVAMRRLREGFEAAVAHCGGTVLGWRDGSGWQNLGGRTRQLEVRSWLNMSGNVVHIEFAGYREVADDTLRAALLERPICVGATAAMVCRQPVSITLSLSAEPCLGHRSRPDVGVNGGTWMGCATG